MLVALAAASFTHICEVGVHVADTLPDYANKPANQECKAHILK